MAGRRYAVVIANLNFPGQPQWRSHEREAAVAAFGGVLDVPLGDPRLREASVIRWFPPSENCTREDYARMQQQRESCAPGTRHINDARHYLHVHDKVACFETWRAHGIPIPDYFTWTPDNFDAARNGAPLPFLLRLNNSVAGQDSWLVREESQIPGVLEELHRRFRRANGAVNRLLCTRYIDTQHRGLNVSYRIIVAGNRVVTGYARVSDPADWVAVTNKFHAGIADAWLETNRRCQQVMTGCESLLVQAVRALGLNHQGLDAIQDAEGRLYFLEVQTTYDAGFIGCGPYVPPYYNPYNRELVKFLQENEPLIAKELPLYHQAWMDKREHFRRCYNNLAIA